MSFTRVLLLITAALSGNLVITIASPRKLDNRTMVAVYVFLVLLYSPLSRIY